jgi:hypothetical protein
MGAKSREWPDIRPTELIGRGPCLKSDIPRA